MRRIIPCAVALIIANMLATVIVHATGGPAMNRIRVIRRMGDWWPLVQDWGLAIGSVILAVLVASPLLALCLLGGN
jgi:hypothetical protein